MAENLGIALLITLIGMSLVFGAICLLWLVMAVLVRLTADKAVSQAEPTLVASEPAPIEAPVADEREVKRRAAVAAVAVALARRRSTYPHVYPIPPTAIVSAWQAVMRGRQLKQRGPVR